MKRVSCKRRFNVGIATTVFLLLLVIVSGSVVAQSSKISKIARNTQSNGQFKNPDGYVEYLPANYDSRNDWPLLIWHHGLGKGGSGSLSDLDKLRNHAIMNWLKTHDVPFVVLSPQDGNGYFGAGRMELFYKWAKGAYQSKTNTNAYHISVLSASGAGLATFLEDNSQFAKEVATLTINGALTGSGNNTIYTNVVNNDTKVWFHHGSSDYTVGYGAPLNFFRGLVSKSGGPDHSKFRYTLYDGMGHSAWNEVYDNSGINKAKVTGSISGGNYGNYYNWTSGSWYDWMLQNAKGQDSVDPTPPVVDAGENETLTLPTNSVELSAQVTVNNSSIDSYKWEKISGPSAYQLSNPNAKTCITSGLVEGSYTFKFTATTVEGLSDSDQIEVMVSGPSVIAPFSLSLTNNIIDENNLSGALVGELTADGTNPIAFNLISGYGDTDNHLFELNGNNLIINTVADYESKSAYSIRVRASNEAGSDDKAFTILVNDVQERTIGDRLAKLNFGRNNSTPVEGWNNLFLNNPVAGEGPFALVDDNGDVTNWQLSVTNSFLSTQDVIGPNTGNNSGIYPDDVMKHAWMDRWGAEIEISGLDNSKLYTINIFGNTQNSQALMQSHVNNQQIGGSVNVQNNAITNEYEFIATNVAPVNGSIKISVNGDNSNGRNYAYMAAMTISETSGSNSRTVNQSNISENFGEEEIWRAVSVFPNPSQTGVFTIDGLEEGDNHEYRIINLKGIVVQEGIISKQLSLQATPGMYILHIPALNKQIRIIKE